ncbi:MAG TPA: (2Fe-2S) ferredoxin domain-containing protein [Crinalium sp.]|jgi:(2Fe-2S) ferredoxin
MSKHKHDAKTDFQLEGRFLGFAAKDSYKLKYLRLATATGEYVIKIDKELRSTLWRALIPGEWVQVSGYQKGDRDLGTAKLKAYQVTAIPPGSTATLLPPSAPAQAPTPKAGTPKANILICQKSDCCKRGGGAVANALQEVLSDRQLTDQVAIKGTGCMKQCKTGPHIVMPDKTRYSGIKPSAIPGIIDKHFQSNDSSHAQENCPDPQQIEP